MVWLPKCCVMKTTTIKDINSVLNQDVDLYTSVQETKQINGIQNTTYNKTLIISKKCYIKDRSISAQESAISQNKVNPTDTKELIFDHFDIRNINITKITWKGSEFVVLGKNYLSSIKIDGLKYSYVVSILVGLTKL